MLTLYRRHRATCKYKSHRVKCFCPIWVQWVLRGEKIRRSLDLTNWEAANKLVRDWEADGRKEVPTVEEAAARFITDLKSRGLSQDTFKKFHLLTETVIHAGQFYNLAIYLTPPDTIGCGLTSFANGTGSI